MTTRTMEVVHDIITEIHENQWDYRPTVLSGHERKEIVDWLDRCGHLGRFLTGGDAAEFIGVVEVARGRNAFRGVM